MEEQVNREQLRERQQKLMEGRKTDPQSFAFPTQSSLATSALGTGPTSAQFYSSIFSICLACLDRLLRTLPFFPTKLQTSCILKPHLIIFDFCVHISELLNEMMKDLNFLHQRLCNREALPCWSSFSSSSRTHTHTQKIKKKLFILYSSSVCCMPVPFEVLGL